jgi:transcriptional regulator with XRE-family HTH domain
VKRNKVWLYGKIGEFLKDERAKSGFTQAEVAEKMGYETAQFLSNIERGKSAIPYEFIRKVIKIYGVSETVVVQYLVSLQQEFIEAEIKNKKLKI